MYKPKTHRHRVRFPPPPDSRTFLGSCSVLGLSHVFLLQELVKVFKLLLLFQTNLQLKLEIPQFSIIVLLKSFLFILRLFEQDLLLMYLGKIFFLTIHIQTSELSSELRYVQLSSQSQTARADSGLNNLDEILNFQVCLLHSFLPCPPFVAWPCSATL
jgi:hypothetical protein